MTENTTTIQDGDVSLFALLHDRRCKKNLSFEEIAASLNVKVKYLQFLEQTNETDVVQYPYLSGLIRLYANFLEIDVHIVNEWMKRHPFQSNVSNKKYRLLNIGENLDLKPDKDQFFNFVFISILLFFIFFMIYNFYEDNGRLIDSSQLVIELAK